MPTEQGWEVVERHGTAGELHQRPFPSPARRQIDICHLAGPALVLGSTQTPALVATEAAAAAGVEVVRRRSGGGAVLLDPQGSVWIDVTIPRGDDRWDHDVNRSFGWLGARWAAALATFGLAGSVHDGPLVRTPASALVCFAGLGPGEVSVDGRKAVGLSQRRTREGARFQAVVYVRAMPPAGDIVDLLVEPVGAAARAALRAQLDTSVARLDTTPAAIVAALLSTFG